MPNHVQNIIKFTGDESEISSMLAAIQQDRFGIGSIDFDKVIPMPETLHIESGSNTIKGYNEYKKYISLLSLFRRPNNLDELTSDTETEDEYLRNHPDIDRNIWNLGKAAFINQYRYGAQTWYEWAIAHWGTKWNSYGYSEDMSDFDATEGIRFQTAWAAPHPVVEALASQYPNIRFEHMWADEDIGQNCGCSIYDNGELAGGYYPESDLDAVSFACSIWAFNPEDLGLTLNATGDRYINPYEECDLARFNGKLILYSNDRMTDADVPIGLHTYHLQENLSKDPMSYIVKKATNDFAATIITKDEFDLGSEGRIALNPSEQITFEDKRISIFDYWHGDLDMAEDYSAEDVSGISPMM